VDDGKIYEPGEIYRLSAHSFALFINRAPRPARPAAIGTAAEEPVLFPVGFQVSDDPQRQ
jgi:hypothetical protein